MKIRRLYILFLLLLTISATHAQLDDWLKKTVKGLTQGSSSLSDGKIIDGLKEALSIGSSNAVDIVSKVDGYYKNPLIMIPLPEELKKIESTARNFGLGSQFDEFLLSMNRAAESASKDALPIFWDAIKQMNFEDARKILNGRENEATLYFRDKTSAKLTALFKPKVTEAMDGVGVTNTYKTITSKIESIPFLKVNTTDLDQYVTDKTLDGLFYMLAQEEKQIRKDPAARVTDLLKDVFGGSGG